MKITYHKFELPFVYPFTISPAQYRVNGPFANMKEFYEAFGVKPGSKMYRPDSLRVVIW